MGDNNNDDDDDNNNNNNNNNNPLRNLNSGRKPGERSSLQAAVPTSSRRHV